jgi:tetratricopeptide (TPR) repeat protein
MKAPVADPDALVQHGASLYQSGRFGEAEASSRKALKARPAHLGALSLLGVSLYAQGKYARAAETFSQLTRRKPENADHWINLGTALRAQGRATEALAAYARAAALGEASADLFYNVGLAHLEQGNFAAARTALRDAARLAPDDAEICYQYAVCCDEMMRHEEAIDALEQWPRMRGLTTGMLAKIALQLMKLGELGSAARAVERAARDPHPDDDAVLRMIQVQERTNRITEARAGLARLKSGPRVEALGADLKLVEARLAERDGELQKALDLCRELMDATPEFHLRHQYLFPMAKVLDAQGRPDEAMAALEEAHRSQVDYLKLATPNAPAWGNKPFRIADLACDPADVTAWDATGAPAREQCPVFIVGFPRSGTTLLEQSLDAHPSLESMDETRFMHNAIDRMVAGGVSYPDRLATLTLTQLEDLREHYWKSVRGRITLAPGQRLLDKNPLNLFALPAIHRLFPNACILLAIRHPCDVILSCYMQHFRAPDFTLLCSDLPSLATGYRRAFDFWYREAEVLAPTVREVRYETLVAEFESQVRAIADFLGLAWDDAMLEPAAHAHRKGFISTPSYTQVVQPIHTRSIHRWKAYEPHFRQVVPLVRPYLERWGYGT